MKQNNFSPLCKSLPIDGSFDLQDLSRAGVSDQFSQQAGHADCGQQIYWGMPFDIGKVHVLRDETVQFSLPSTKARWICFLHTAEDVSLPGELWNAGWSESGLADWRELGRTGASLLNELAATYHVIYADGSEEKYEIRYRHQINTGSPDWGEKSFQAVPQNSQFAYDQDSDNSWGRQQFRHHYQESNLPQQTFMNWICAWENPHPEKEITGLRMEPGLGCVVLSAMTACDTEQTPIRWLARKKVLLRLSATEVARNLGPDADHLATRPFHSNYLFLNEGRRSLLRLDMGSVLSVVPRYAYNNDDWDGPDLNEVGEREEDEFLIEYVAHAQAQLHVSGQEPMSLSELESAGATPNLTVIPPAEQWVRLRVIDKKHRQPVAVRLHVHGDHDEYLTPVDRQRIPNSNIYEGPGAELTGPSMHTSTYINGETVIKLPLGNVYIEVSKGFECTPVRTVRNITGATRDISIEIDKVLGWREKGWVTADTHVHFLSPKTANLEGAAEGVNVVNLLASQWGEFMTNVGDFDGKSTFVDEEAGDKYFVRVGTENRQNVMGHISLLGYGGNIITPLCTGGANEAAIGDPVDVLVTEWARQCRDQGGLVVVPHFPGPRAEHAATIVSGLVDAIEIDGDMRREGIQLYELVNWYRYLNCGYQVPLTGRTDKMAAYQDIGHIRVYSKLSPGCEFTYDAWMDSVRSGNTFVTFGPLLEFAVDGNEAGSRIDLGKTGGTVTVTWQAETVRHSMTGIELIVNGEVVGGQTIDGDKATGYFEVECQRSSWICVLIRGTRTSTGKEEILAHSSSVMVEIEGSRFFAAADAVSILEQIEGSMAYIDHVGTRAETRRYKEMRLLLEQAHKTLHDRLHQSGHDHSHDIGRKHH